MKIQLCLFNPNSVALVGGGNKRGVVFSPDVVLLELVLHLAEHEGGVGHVEVEAAHGARLGHQLEHVRVEVNEQPARPGLPHQQRRVHPGPRRLDRAEPAPVVQDLKANTRRQISSFVCSFWPGCPSWRFSTL